MRGRLSSSAAVAVAVVILVSTMAVTAVAAGGASAGDSQTDGNYTLSDFRDGGIVIPETNPSKRWLGYQGSVWVSYEETNFIKELSKMGGGGGSWTVDHVMKPGATVDTDEVTLHFSRGRRAESETIHVVTVFGQQKRVTTNGTTKTVVTNVEEKVTEVSLEGPSDVVTIGLPNHQSQRMMLMYVKEYPDARWTGTHHSVALTSQVPFGPNWSSFLPWALKWFVITGVVGVLLGFKGAEKALEKADAGPGKSAGWWVFTGGLLAYVAMYFKYGAVAGALVAAPFLLGLVPGALTFFIALDKLSDIRKVLIEGVVTRDTVNPLGEDVPDIEEEEGTLLHATEVEESDELALVKDDNLRAFLLNFAFDVENPRLDVSAFESEVRYDGFADTKIYAASPEEREEAFDSELEEDESPPLLHIRWPSVEISASNLKTENEDGAEWDRSAVWSAALGFGVMTLFGHALLGSWTLAALVGSLPVIKAMSEGHDGVADLVPAPNHSTSAKARAVTEREEYTVATTFDQLEQKVAEQDVKVIERASSIAESYMKEMRSELDNLLGDPEDDGAASGTSSASSEVPTDD